MTLPAVGLPRRDSLRACVRAFPGGARLSRRAGPTRKCVPAPRVGAEGRRFQTSPALPAERAVSAAGFPGAAEGRRARSAGREGDREGVASETRRSAVEPGPSTDLALPLRLARQRQQRDPGAARRPVLSLSCS